MKIIGFIALVLSIKGVISTCPVGYPFATSVGDYCFWVHDFNSATDWDMAEQECQQDAGSLAVLDTAAKQTAVINALSLVHLKKYWIGLTDVDVEGTFYWTNGRALGWEGWWYTGSMLSSQPNGKTTQNCVYLEGTTWQDRPCSGSSDMGSAALCQLKGTGFVCTSGRDCKYAVADTTWTARSPSTMCLTAISSELMTWSDAEDQCQVYGGHLLTLRSQSEYDTFQNYMSTYPGTWDIWLGMSDVTTEGCFQYTDGYFPQWVNWNSASPLYGNGDCVALQRSDTFYDTSCTTTKAFRCEIYFTDMLHCSALATSSVGNATTIFSMSGQVTFQCHPGYSFQSGEKEKVVTCTVCDYWDQVTDLGNCDEDTVTTQEPIQTTAVAPFNCTTDGVQVAINGGCYWLGSEELTGITQFEAQSKCQVHGGTLAVLETTEVQKQVAATLNLNENSSYWIGLDDSITEGVFYWSNGRVSDWESWATTVPLQPDGKNVENCVYITNLEWYDTSCDVGGILPMGYICQEVTSDFNCTSGKDCIRSASDSTWPARDMDTMCVFSPTPELMTWDKANIKCQLYGADLVTLRSPDEYNTLHSRLNKGSIEMPGLEASDIWLGVSDLSVEGVFQYTDGYYPQSIHWDMVSPSAANGDCVLLTLNGFFTDTNCSLTKTFFCEISNDSLGSCGALLQTNVTNAVGNYSNNQMIYTCDPGYRFPSGETQVILNCTTCGYWRDIELHGDFCQLAIPDTTQTINSVCSTEVLNSTNACYWAGFVDSLTWSEAEALCKADGGTLAVLQSTDVQDFVLSRISVPNTYGMWIGLRDDVIEGVFYWNDGRIYQWESWDSIGNQPNGQTSENCVYVQNTKAWQDKNCGPNIGRGYICQTIPPGFYCTDSEQDCFLPGPYVAPSARDAHCLYIMESNTWAGANLACQSFGGQMLTLRADTENNLIHNSLVSKGLSEVWLGMSDRDLRGTYKYTDGIYPQWVEWQPGSPVEANGECVYRNSLGKFQDTDCSLMKPVMCELRLATIQNTPCGLVDDMGIVIGNSYMTRGVSDITYSCYTGYFFKTGLSTTTIDCLTCSYWNDTLNLGDCLASPSSSESDLTTLSTVREVTTVAVINTVAEVTSVLPPAAQSSTEHVIPRRDYIPKTKTTAWTPVEEFEEDDPEEAPYAKAIGYPLCAASMAALGLLITSDLPVLSAHIKKAVHTIYKFLACSKRDKARKKKDNPLII